MKIQQILLPLLLSSLLACTGSGTTEEGFTSLNQPSLQGKADGYNNTKPSELPDDFLVVPNRSDSTIAILDSVSGEVIRTITSEQTGFEFEPIYATHLNRYNLIAVSDRKTNVVMIFDSSNFEYLGGIPASEGLFHMWPSKDQKEIFVVADKDNTVDAIAFNRYGGKVVYSRRVFEIGDYVPEGKPHDIVADKNFFYVTVQVKEDEMDYVLKVRRSNLRAVGALEFSLDTHLGMPVDSPFLLVPESTDGQLNLVDRNSFQVVSTLDGTSGAHGIWWDRLASRIFLADFSSKGPASVYEVRRTPGSFAMKIQNIIDLEDAKAHNITVDFDNDLMFVTHSGPNNDGELNRNVSLIDIADPSNPQVVDSIETGSNPLGILFVER